MDFDAYLDALASGAPTPGGGSAATVVGALAAALCAMVARITAGAPRHAAVHPEAGAIAADADALRAAFLGLRPLDEGAFAAVVAAQALPRGTDADRDRRAELLQAALAQAAAVPLEVAEHAVEALALTVRTATLGNAHLASDLVCAAAFARAAFEAAAANVRVNHRYLRDPALVEEQRERLDALAVRAGELDRAAGAAVATGS